MVAVKVTVPLPVPEAGLRVSHVALSVAVQLNVPPPVLLMLRTFVAGLAPPAVAAKERLVGLAPIAGLIEGIGAEGGEINCANPGISAANLFIDRPPPPPLPEVDDLPVLAAASGMVPVGAEPAEIDPVVVVADGAMCTVESGAAMEERRPVFLLSEEVSLEEVVLSGSRATGGVAKELGPAVVGCNGTTDAALGLCGFRMSRWGFRVDIGVSFLS